MNKKAKKIKLTNKTMLGVIVFGVIIVTALILPTAINAISTRKLEKQIKKGDVVKIIFADLTVKNCVISSIDERGNLYGSSTDGKRAGMLPSLNWVEFKNWYENRAYPKPSIEETREIVRQIVSLENCQNRKYRDRNFDYYKDYIKKTEK